MERWRALEGLVDDEDLDALLSLVTLDEIAASWCSYAERPHDPGSDEEDADWWAVQLFFTTELCSRPDLYKALLLKLIEHARSSDVLGAIGAGPLENFVSDDEDDLRWLEQQCETNEGLREALSVVWCWNDATEATMQRMDRAAGVELRRPRPREEWPASLLAVEAAESRLTAIAGRGWHEQLFNGTILTSEMNDAIDEYYRAVRHMHDEDGTLTPEMSAAFDNYFRNRSLRRDDDESSR